jgi:PAS domain S-box-containing protein
MSRFEELTKAADDRMRRFQRAMGIHRPKFPAPRETNSDLEERRRAQDTLRNLRELVDSIPGLVCTISSTGELELFNRQILEYFGKTPEELRDWANSDAVHPDDRSRVISAFRHSIKSGTPYDIEHRCRRADGIYRWFQVRAHPVRDADGHITSWYGLLTDIDDRKSAEEALRANGRDLDHIINTVPVLAWSARTDGSADFVNQHYLDYVGLSQQQVQGRGWTSAVHPDDLDGLIGAWQHMMNSDAGGECEARLRRFDGEYRWFMFRTNPLRDESGKTVKWYGTNVDIEDRKRADEELRRSEAFLAQGQRLNLTGTFLWRVDTDEITFSEELYRIHEFERDTPVTLDRIRSRIHPEDIPVLTEKIGGARDDEVVHDYEIRLQMPDGSVKYLHTISQGIRRQDGRLEHIGAVQDVTQRRLSEEALAKVRSELAHVARITSLGVLTASIAHEVNQPLAAIIANGETGLRWLARPEPSLEKARELTTRVVADARRASEIIDRIRTMAARRTPKSALLSLGDVVEESMVFLRHEFQSKRISVSLDLAPALPAVVGDRTQIQQVIVNLAINAVQALAQSEAEPRSIAVRTMLSDLQTVGCTIEDSGPGIDPVHLPRLFDSFFTTKDSGMGMGLPISRSIVDAHGGRIRADNDSALGGARFSFELPAHGAGGSPATGK